MALLLAPASHPLRGDLSLPGDKSISHRAVLIGSLARGAVRIRGLLESADVLSTIGAVRALGISVEREAGASLWRVEGRGIDGYREPARPIDCGNSGTTARLIAGLLAATPGMSVLTGDDSLSRRPMGRVVKPLRLAGATVLGRAGGRLLPLAIEGRQLEGFEYEVPEPSAQVKSALILAALKARGESCIRQRIETRDHTERMLAHLGVSLVIDRETLRLRGPQEPRAADMTVPGDPSSAAFFAVAASLVPGSEIVLRGVCLNPTRTGFLRVLERMGAHIETRMGPELSGEPTGDLTVRHAELSATRVAAEEIPSLVDEVPVLAVAAARARGTTVFRGVGELRTKESNRLAALVRELSALGVRLRESGEDLEVDGPAELRGTAVDAHDDHRMAMSLAVASLLAEGPTELEGHGCVGISFPAFFEEVGRLQGAGCRL